MGFKDDVLQRLSELAIVILDTIIWASCKVSVNVN